jgi:hypothetical protein
VSTPARVATARTVRYGLLLLFVIVVFIPV